MENQTNLNCTTEERLNLKNKIEEYITQTHTISIYYSSYYTEERRKECKEKNKQYDIDYEVLIEDNKRQYPAIFLGMLHFFEMSTFKKAVLNNMLMYTALNNHPEFTTPNNVQYRCIYTNDLILQLQKFNYSNVVIKYTKYLEYCE